MTFTNSKAFKIAHKFSLQLFFAAALSFTLADVSHIIVDDESVTTTTSYPPRPYAFAYQAGRAPGHVDSELKLSRLFFRNSDDWNLQFKFLFDYKTNRLENSKIHSFYPGTHAEVGDGAGLVKGAYSYIDPLNQVRTVEYVADEHGFYPQLSHPVVNTKAVDLANKRHFQLYNKIAQEHSDPNFAARYAAAHVPASLPRETPAVGEQKIFFNFPFD